jgi:hypothetical protein
MRRIVSNKINEQAAKRILINKVNDQTAKADCEFPLCLINNRHDILYDIVPIIY